MDEPRRVDGLPVSSLHFRRSPSSTTSPYQQEVQKLGSSREKKNSLSSTSIVYSQVPAEYSNEVADEEVYRAALSNTRKCPPLSGLVYSVKHKRCVQCLFSSLPLPLTRGALPYPEYLMNGYLYDDEGNRIAPMDDWLPRPQPDFVMRLVILITLLLTGIVIIINPILAICADWAEPRVIKPTRKFVMKKVRKLVKRLREEKQITPPIATTSSTGGATDVIGDVKGDVQINGGDKTDTKSTGKEVSDEYGETQSSTQMKSFPSSSSSTKEDETEEINDSEESGSDSSTALVT